MNPPIDDRTEWLETDGLGGFASGTTSGIRTRRYHGLLVAATTPPTGRYMLVNGLDVVVRTPEGEFPLAFHRYQPGVTNETERARIESFSADPWPRWGLRLSDGTRLVHELFMTRGAARTVLSWRLLDPQAGVTLRVRPLLSGRDYHSLHHENPAFNFNPTHDAKGLVWKQYPDVPGIAAAHNGRYTHEPAWYRQFLYVEERARGFDHQEDLASPGVLEFDLSSSEACLVLGAPPSTPANETEPVARTVERLRAAERRRRAALGSPLRCAADHYLVEGSRGTTIIAGYPWFADWGRDTFIALRGLCLATGRLEEARDILLAWADTDSVGVLPNRFPDQGAEPEYNSVDASLWFIIAAHELMAAAAGSGRPLSSGHRKTLKRTIQRVLGAYAKGTHHGIRMDSDGLLLAGAPGVQLTWMDARVGERVITPRTGKPVEVQALWLNALHIGAADDARWSSVYENGVRSFRARFWNAAQGCLSDVVDDNDIPGAVDPSIRPNQLLAVGGLPLNLLTPEHARAVVDRVERTLLTPLGLRSLDPSDPRYARRYRDGPGERDAAYHQGTVWPWLLGPFVEAWVRTRGNSPAARAEARERFITPLLAHVERAGLGHVSEVMDGDAPHAPGGCPFQAWSIGELLRLDRIVLRDPPEVIAIRPWRPAPNGTEAVAR